MLRCNTSTENRAILSNCCIIITSRDTPVWTNIYQIFVNLIQKKFKTLSKLTEPNDCFTKKATGCEPQQNIYRIKCARENEMYRSIYDCTIQSIEKKNICILYILGVVETFCLVESVIESIILCLQVALLLHQDDHLQIFNNKFGSLDYWDKYFPGKTESMHLRIKAVSGCDKIERNDGNQRVIIIYVQIFQSISEKS